MTRSTHASNGSSPSSSKPEPPAFTRSAQLAEGLATFVLVFAGCGAIVVDSERGGSLGAGGIAAVFGLAIMVMIYATGHLSGAHINPAVTLAFTLTRHFPARDAMGYIPAQLGGAVAGAAVLARRTRSPRRHSAERRDRSGRDLRDRADGNPHIRGHGGCDRHARRRSSRAIAVGGAVGLDALFGGGVTGASMNPARSFGPALIASEWSQFWIYVLGPVAGAILGALLYQLVRHEPNTAP